MPGGLSDNSLKPQYNPNIYPEINRNVTPMQPQCNPNISDCLSHLLPLLFWLQDSCTEGGIRHDSGYPTTEAHDDSPKVLAVVISEAI